MYRLCALLFCLLSANQALASPVETLQTALRVGTGLDHWIETAAGPCDAVRRRHSEPPALPVSVGRDDYLLCMITSGNRHGLPPGEIALAFADGRLALAEIRGAALLETLLPQGLSQEQAVPYAGWNVFPEGAWVVSKDKGAAWHLEPASLHPHLFLFRNPLLDYSSEPGSSRTGRFEIPDFLTPGTPMDLAERKFRAGCGFVEIVTIDPPTLPVESDTQHQINCFGWPLAGAHRKLEAVFSDDGLALVWILTAPQEYDRLVETLTTGLGDPVADVTNYVVWPGGVALRRDKPEIAIASNPVAAALFQ